MYNKGNKHYKIRILYLHIYAFIFTYLQPKKLMMTLEIDFMPKLLIILIY